METAKIGPWKVTFDAALTQQAYEGCVGAAEVCGCPKCLRYVATRESAFPPEALALFATLGINAACEAEIDDMGPVAQGGRRYFGWFHFIGTVEDGSSGFVSYSGGRFTLTLSAHPSLLRPAFAGYPIVQLEFRTTTLPANTPPLAP